MTNSQLLPEGCWPPLVLAPCDYVYRQNIPKFSQSITIWSLVISGDDSASPN
jgi:hypothetical protein